MKKIFILLFLTFILSGCATYKFQKPATSGAQGYLACYDGKPILEYTVGKEKSLPDLTLAKERFGRRRLTVERYYKQMGQIESRLKEFLWDSPAMVVGFLGGILRWPFIAVADYKYNHELKYKIRTDRLEEEKEALEIARVDSLRKELDAYVVEDLSKESGKEAVVGTVVTAVKSQPEVLPAISEIAPIPVVVIKEEPVIEPPMVSEVTVQSPVEVKPVIEEVPVVKVVLAPPVAVISAQPVKGYSPLKVNFSGQKSYSKSAKIVSYLWDFGDGDVSTKKNAENA